MYTAITLALVVKFIYNIGRFYLLRKSSTTTSYRGAVLVLVESIAIPYTFLNNIYLNKNDFQRSAIEPELLTHELAHVKQWHTIDILLIEVLKIFLWFNPLLYIYKKAIQLNHEFLADEAVIQRHADITSYQELLLTKTCRSTQLSLASSINFSLTKKRFTMMTKNTSTIKGIILKSAVLPVVTALVYLISTETVAHVKNETEKPVILITNPVGDSNTISDIIDDATEINVEQEVSVVVSEKDTVAGDARRDEYFKGVRIVIDDKLRGVKINKRYEKLTPEQKRFYLAEVPERMKANGVNPEDYDYTMGREGTIYYIDDKKVSKDEVLKYNIKDFAKYSAKMSTESKAGGDVMTKTYQSFFYTYDHYDKHMKHLYDHFDEEEYKITILDKPLEPKEQWAVISAYEKQKDGKSDLERSREKRQKEISAPTYSRTAEMKPTAKRIEFQFPGGMDKFHSYLKTSMNTKTAEHRTDMKVSFTVNTDGSLSEISLESEDNPEVEKAMIEALEKSPKWIPGQMDGHPISIGTAIKVSF
jgi:hypothetical protein